MMRIAAALLFAGCLATTGTPQASAPGSEQQASNDEMVCRSETPTGSMISREVCHPKNEHADALNREGLMRSLETPRSNPCGGHGCPMHP